MRNITFNLLQRILVKSCISWHREGEDAWGLRLMQCA
jgi:hypothetical protein